MLRIPAPLIGALDVMPRLDISDELVHFTKGDTPDDAFTGLLQILKEGRLQGSNGNIRGGHTCVCFSEAPLVALENGLLNASAYSRYSPFGILVRKPWLFERGGRPVIYQPEAEYADLPPSHAWRHVRYEPHAAPAIDFTWEREWRIPTEELHINGSNAAVIVPDGKWARRLVADHERAEDLRVLEYSQIMEPEIAMLHREDFEWFIFILRP